MVHSKLSSYRYQYTRTASLLCLLLVTAQSFSVTTRPASALSLQAAMVSEASEWYSPPPAAAAPTPPTGKPVQTFIQSRQEFDAFLNVPDDDRLVIVKFYASWCKSCAKVGLKLDQFARKNADLMDRKTGHVTKKGNVRIAHVEYTANKELISELQIEKLPTIQMYRRDDTGTLQKVEDFSTVPSQFHRVQEKATYHMEAQAYQRKQAAKQREFDFETSLDVGAELIQQTLEQQSNSGLAQLLVQNANAVYASNHDEPTTPSRRLFGRWRRFSNHP